MHWENAPGRHGYPIAAKVALEEGGLCSAEPARVGFIKTPVLMRRPSLGDLLTDAPNRVDHPEAFFTPRVTIGLGEF